MVGMHAQFKPLTRIAYAGPLQDPRITSNSLEMPVQQKRLVFPRRTASSNNTAIETGSTGHSNKEGQEQCSPWNPNTMSFAGVISSFNDPLLQAQMQQCLVDGVEL